MSNVVCCAKPMTLPEGGGPGVSGKPYGLGLAPRTLFRAAKEDRKPARFCHLSPQWKHLTPRTEFLTRSKLLAVPSTGSPTMALGSSGAICRLRGVLVEGGLLSFHPSCSYLGAWEGILGWACVLH